MFERKLPLICWIMDRKRIKEFSPPISLYTKNITQREMVLSWPKGWDCSGCIKCRAWIYNSDCRLKENNLSEMNVILEPGVMLKIRLDVSEARKTLETFAQVIWSRDFESKQKVYPVRVCFLDQKASEKIISLNVKKLP